MNLRKLLRRSYRLTLYLWTTRGRLLSPWKFTADGKEIELLERTHWLRLLHKKELTAVDMNGRFEAAFTDMFVEKLEPDTVLLDIGAATGYYTVLASHFCQPENIHAFEPDVPSRAILGINNRRYCSGKVNIDKRFVGERGQNDRRSISLDEYCETHDIAPTIVKMDIEGAEVQVLRGMRDVCLRHRPVILLEFHIEKMRDEWGVDPEEVPRLLREYGYRIRYNGHHGHLRTHQKQPDTEWHDEQPNDYVCAIIAEPEEGDPDTEFIR